MTTAASAQAETLCREGDEAARAGRFDEAIELLTQAEACNPDHAEICYNLGRVLMVVGQQGGDQARLTEAATRLEKATVLRPDWVEARLAYAKACALAGRMEPAIKAFEAVLETDPTQADAWFWLGETDRQQGRPDAAIDRFQKVLELTPDNLDVRRRLGELKLALGQRRNSRELLEDAVQHFHFLSESQPNQIQPLLEESKGWQLLGKDKQAFDCLEKALAIDPENYELYYLLGIAHSYSGTHREDEERYLRRAVELNPDFREGYLSLSVVLEKMNRLEEARTVIEEAIARWPEENRLCGPLGKLEVRAKHYAKAEELLKRALSSSMDGLEKAQLQTELGKVCEKLQRYEDAFTYYCEAQKALAKTPSYTSMNRQEYLHILQALHRWWPVSRVEKWQTYQPEPGERAPVFFVGFPRSGTTLTEQILNAHPQVVTTQEEPLLGDVIMSFRTLLNRPLACPGDLDKLTPEEIYTLRQAYWKGAEALFAGRDLTGKTVVDKLPLNLPHLPIIARLFPDAKIIIALRDPRDVCLSSFVQVFGANAAMALFDSLESTAVLYDQVMRLYLQYRDTLPVQMLESRYEDIVEDLDGAAHRLLEFLELPWNDEVLQYHKRASKRVINTPSYEGVGEPVYRSARARWKHYARHFDPLKPVLAPYLRAFGYDESMPDFPPLTHEERATAYYQLGDAYAMQERFDEAITAFGMALLAVPGHTLVSMKLGQVELLLGEANQDVTRLESAIALFGNILETQPENEEAMLHLGRALMLVGRALDALPLLQKSAKRRPHEALIHYWLGQCYDMVGQLEKSVKCFTTAVREKPDYIEAYTYKAICEERMNRPEAARNTLESAWKVSPNNPRLLVPMARLERRDGNLDKARTMLEQATQQLEEHGAVFHDLAKIQEKQGEYEQAFHNFAKAQQLLSQAAEAKRSDPAGFRARIEYFQEWYTAERLARWAGWKPHDDVKAPVFLVGFPRSGTTLTEQIISAHPQVVATEEALVLDETVAAIPTLLQHEGELLPFPDVLDTLSLEDISRLRQYYIQRLGHYVGTSAIKAGKTVIDKLPLNIRQLGLIQRLFPEAKILVLLRDPRDACLSCFFQIFQPNHAMANFFTLEDTAALYDKTMQLYLHQRPLLGLQMLEVRYEDMIGDLENYARRMLDFIGLPWDDAVLHYYEQNHNRHVATPSYEGVLKPVYSSSVGRWAHYAHQLQPILPVLEPYLQEFGYKENPS